MYSMMTIVKNMILYTWNLLRDNKPYANSFISNIEYVLYVRHISETGDREGRSALMKLLV